MSNNTKGVPSLTTVTNKVALVLNQSAHANLSMATSALVSQLIKCLNQRLAKIQQQRSKG